MVSFATLFALLFLMAFAALVFNVGQATTRKIEAQNAADAVAYSSSVWVARGMNAITASNHLMGELTALYILHHSLGGKWLDENGQNSPNNHRLLEEQNDTMAALFGRDGQRSVSTSRGNTSGMSDEDKEDFGEEFKKAAKSASAKAASAFPLDRSRPIPALVPPHNTVLENPSADEHSTLFQAKLDLKKWMWKAYALHRTGWVTYEIGEKLLGTPFAAAGAAMMASGVAMQGTALAAELKIWQEYIILNIVEAFAHTTKTIAHAILGTYDYADKGVVHGIANYQTTLQGTEAIPGFITIQAEHAAYKVAQKHGAVGFTLGDIPESLSIVDLKQMAPVMPIEKHERNEIGHAQLMRATYPWVRYWRDKPRRFFWYFTTISNASKHFGVYTNRYTSETVRCMRLVKGQSYAGWDDYGIHPKGMGLRLYVVKGLNQTGKGKRQGFEKSKEDWNQPGKGATAERYFTHLGLARRSSPRIASGAVFRSENPDGFVCFAQSMIYNANRQQKPHDSGDNGAAQPAVGWDTLNWIDGATEYVSEDRGPEFPGRLTASFPPVSRPEIKINWQAKLTPTTYRKLAPVAVSAYLLEKVPHRGVSEMAGPLARAREGLFLNNH